MEWSNRNTVILNYERENASTGSEAPTEFGIYENRVLVKAEVTQKWKMKQKGKINKISNQMKLDKEK